MVYVHQGTLVAEWCECIREFWHRHGVFACMKELWCYSRMVRVCIRELWYQCGVCASQNSGIGLAITLNYLI